MNLFRKGFVLLFALLFPVIIFLFLKFFGQNEYELSVYNSSCSDSIGKIFSDSKVSLNNIKILDVRLNNDNLLIDNYINKLESICDAIFFAWRTNVVVCDSTIIINRLITIKYFFISFPP